MSQDSADSIFETELEYLSMINTQVMIDDTQTAERFLCSLQRKKQSPCVRIGWFFSMLFVSLAILHLECPVKDSLTFATMDHCVAGSTTLYHITLWTSACRCLFLPSFYT